MSRRSVHALTWFTHRRTEGLCARLGWRYVVIDTRSTGLVRYAKLIPRTLLYLIRSRPTLLVVQSPSVVLTMFCLLLRPLWRYKLIVDAHNEAVQPYILTSRVAARIVAHCLRHSDLTVVTNHSLAEKVVKAGGRAFVLPDPVPSVPSGVLRSRAVEGSLFQVVVIATFAEDEPIKEILKAASGTTDSFVFYITGNAQKLAGQVLKHAGSNVRFTGFLPEQDYWELLAGCDAIVDLTKMPDCLVCGAYEAVAVGRPIVLTDGRAARDWFGESATYIDNSSNALIDALRTMREMYPTKLEGVRSAKERMESEWARLAGKLEQEFARL